MLLRRSLKVARCSINVPTRLFSSVDPEVLNPMSTTPVTHDFKIVDTTENPTWPMFQMMDLYGAQVPEAPAIDCDPEVARQMYTVMARVKALDDVFYNAQVQFWRFM